MNHSRVVPESKCNGTLVASGTFETLGFEWTRATCQRCGEVLALPGSPSEIRDVPHTPLSITRIQSDREYLPSFCQIMKSGDFIVQD